VLCNKLPEILAVPWFSYPVRQSVAQLPLRFLGCCLQMIGTFPSIPIPKETLSRVLEPPHGSKPKGPGSEGCGHLMALHVRTITAIDASAKAIPVSACVSDGQETENEKMTGCLLWRSGVKKKTGRTDCKGRPISEEFCSAGGEFRTRDLQIMSIALVGEPLEITK